MDPQEIRRLDALREYPELQPQNHLESNSEASEAGDYVELPAQVPSIPNLALQHEVEDMNEDIGLMRDTPQSPIIAALELETKIIARSIIPLIVSIWILLFAEDLDSWGFCFCWMSCCVLALISFKTLRNRPDSQTYANLPVFESFNFQLIAISGLSQLAIVAMDICISHKEPGLFPSNIKSAKKFKSSWETTPENALIFFWNNFGLWVLSNLNFCFVAFSVLLLLNLPLVLYRMSLKSALVKELIVIHQVIIETKLHSCFTKHFSSVWVQIYELCAIGLPLAYLVAPFGVMNVIAYLVPPAFQSITNIMMWSILHLLLIIWEAIVVCGMIYYPDIPLSRPMGLPGYILMESATTMQALTVQAFFNYICLGRCVYLQIYPGGYEAPLGFWQQSELHFRQLPSGEPAETWNYHIINPFGLDFLEGTAIFIIVFRIFKLFRFAMQISQRIEEDWDVLVEDFG